MPVSLYANPSATLELLNRFGHSPKKNFGQNFLVNDHIIEKIINLADISFEDVVLEVGPGIGTLTYALCNNAKDVVAVEKDTSLLEILEFTLADYSNFELINKDALKIQAKDLQNLHPNKFVSNLPYAVAATLVLDYFERFSFLESATVMVQKEVAERMMAKPGTKNYGSYTVKLSLYAKFIDSFVVSPENFMPKPHVNSTVIRLDRILQTDVSSDVIGAACMMADAAFASRRKTILNSCKHYFASKSQRIDADKLYEIFHHAQIDPSVRGETLTTKDYLKLGSAYLAVKNENYKS